MSVALVEAVAAGDRGPLLQRDRLAPTVGGTAMAGGACLGGALAAGWCDAAPVSSESKRALSAFSVASTTELILILGSCLSNTAWFRG
jgi:hypothetical protein